MIFDEASTETSTEQGIYDLKTEIYSRNNTGTHATVAHWATAAACPGASVSALISEEPPSPLQPQGSSSSLSPIAWLHDQSLSDSSALSEPSLILIKSYNAPHDLSPWPVCLIPFHSPPLTLSAPATLVLAAAQTHQAHFWQPLPPYKRGFP